MNIPTLDLIELRVLGSLMEKSKTTPDYYPMTIHGLTSACNQKTSRKPVVSYHEDTVASALNSLKKRNLVSTSFEGSSRVLKYRHNFGAVFPLIPAEITIICLLVLRGPQTPGELNTNSGRMHEYESLEEILEILEKLSSIEFPFLIQLPKRTGQKEVRFAQLLGGPITMAEEIYLESDLKDSKLSLETRLTSLEEEVRELKSKIVILQLKTLPKNDF
jgi:uncharacterized protein YceH (UPF0502 family)